MGVDFHWSITFGDALVVLGGITVAGSFLFRSGSSVERLHMAVTTALDQIGELKQEIKQMGKVLTELAVQKEQITMLTKWYDELRRGVGRINGNNGDH